MSHPPPLDFPAQPTSLEAAQGYLTWIADRALRGDVDRDRALAATKAIEAWMRAENFAREIRELRKQVTALAKATAKRHG